MNFCLHFQLPVRYETGIELLTSWQTTYTHLSNHIHEWRAWRLILLQADIPEFLKDWFIQFFPIFPRMWPCQELLPRSKQL